MKSEGGWRMWSRQEQSHYFRELIPYLVASVLLILAGAGLGILSSTATPKLSSARAEVLGDFAKLFLELPKPYLALAIFLNNGLKTLAVIIIGPLAGVLPLIFLLVNGYVLGFVLHMAVQSEGLLAAVVSIVPHGILELPAILLGTSIGLMLGVEGLKRLFGKGKNTLSAELGRGVRFFLVIILPLLLLSAFIEAFITSVAVSK
jgi:stage II sporulation protein M